MALNDHVHIAKRFQRSVRIDTDIHNPSSLEGFIFPQTFAETLLSVGRQVNKLGHGAFTWTGPYGSGKSSLVVAFSTLLNGQEEKRQRAAERIGVGTARKLWELLPPKTHGWRVLPIVGRREDPTVVIGEALNSSGFLPKKRQPKTWNEKSVVDAIGEIAALNPRSHGGLILFIDEMGKFLEAAALKELDIYIFQQLAELSSRSQNRLILIGILHQSFDEYAHRLSRDMRDEWSKIQGRFVDLPINVAGDEQLRFLSSAIISNRPLLDIRKLAKSVATHLGAHRPDTPKDVEETLERCWPLHPVTACLLGPISRRRFGQNQRSIFGFLNSSEPQGFQHFLKNAKKDSLYGPDRLWDYLRINLEPAILASPDGHRWSLAADAVDRCEAFGGDSLHIKLCKSIAITEMFKDRSGLFPTKDLLLSCCPNNSPEEIETAISQLSKWSLIIFKRFLNSYAIYAGSDFDIEQAIKECLGDIKEINFKALQTLAGLNPILAKRHYHETGALRWFGVGIVPISKIMHAVDTFEPQGGAMGQFLLAIPTLGEAPREAKEKCQAAARSANQWDTIIGLSQRSWIVTELAKELLALEKVRHDRPELSGDAVARREVNARIAVTLNQLEEELRYAFDNALWYTKDGKEKRLSLSEINSLASSLADQKFPATPRLPNELLNRLRPSSNANAARNALLRRMVMNEGEERLGIKGYPPEGGLFESLLEKPGLYVFSSDRWRFVVPSQKYPDKCTLAPLWEAASDLFVHNQTHTVGVDEIYELWKAPPFGVSDGLLPLLAVAYIISIQDRAAFYRNGIFQSKFKDLDVEYLIKNPKDIQLRSMNLSEISKKILSIMAELVEQLDESNKLLNPEPIDVARGLISVFDKIHPWTLRTTRLSKNAMRIRDLFRKANDPNKFLFDDIPSLLKENDRSHSHNDIDQIVRLLSEGLEELCTAYSNMLKKLCYQMLSELQVHTNSIYALAELRKRAENIRQLTGDFKLEAFIARISQFAGTLEEIEGLASLAASKPTRDWVDRDFDVAAIELSDFAQRFNRAEAFAHIKGRPNKRHAMAIIVGLDTQPQPVYREFDIFDTDRQAVDDVISKLNRALNGTKKQKKNVILAALAELSAHYISEVDT